MDLESTLGGTISLISDVVSLYAVLSGPPPVAIRSCLSIIRPCLLLDFSPSQNRRKHLIYLSFINKIIEEVSEIDLHFLDKITFSRHLFINNILYSLVQQPVKSVHYIQRYNENGHVWFFFGATTRYLRRRLVVAPKGGISVKICVYQYYTFMIMMVKILKLRKNYIF